MKTKIALLIGLFGFFMTALTSCYNSDREKEATLIINLGATRIQAALETWPPSNADLSKLEYDIKISGPTEITEKVKGGSGPIILAVTPGYYTITVTAYSDGVLYARGTNEATVKSGQNNVPITMRRAGIYEIEVAVLPDEKYIQKGDNFTFGAKSFYGPLSIEVDDGYMWSLSGNKSPQTKINEATGELFVDSSEPADALTVTAESKTYSSKSGTANVILINPNITLVHAKQPTISGQPQDATYSINGAAIALTVTADVDDGGALSYQWYKNTTNSISSGTSFGTANGAQTKDYTPSTSELGIIYYYVVVTNTNNSVNGDKTALTVSDTAAVTVNNFVNAAPPKITDQPISASYVQNATATKLTITAESIDGGTLSYQWYSNSSNSNIGGTSLGAGNGANTKDYTPDTGAVGILYYYCEITNIITNNGDGGVKTAMVKSNVVTVTVTLEVTNITDVPDKAAPGDPLTLTGTVVPNNATYKNIEWSVNDAGGTGATIAAGSNILNTTAAGTVTITATIKDGLAIGTDYTQDFNITVKKYATRVSIDNTKKYYDTLTDAFNSIEDDQTVTITVFENIPAQTPISITTTVGKTKTITLTCADDNDYTIQLDSSGGALFSIGAGVNFTVKGSSTKILTLKGVTSNTDCLVYMSGLTFELKDNAIITGNTNVTAVSGGGVYVYSGSFFTMSGGTISDNQVITNGGGVYVESSGSFTMSGGTISGNEALYGGGVSVIGTFTMSGGTISGNKAGNGGGGVYKTGAGIFTMSGGTIGGTSSADKNTTAMIGGGVYMNNGTFNMSGGAISGNESTATSAGQGGGGVYIYDGYFNMSGTAIISGNTATNSEGGGVYFRSGTFNMSGGTIGGTGPVDKNTALSNGGGVYIEGTFNMSGGTISGNEAISGSGGGVYKSSGLVTGNFTMSDTALISGNTSSSSGGGVNVDGGDFVMNSGTINGNTSNTGGGVYAGATFYMNGGTISGNTATTTLTNGGGGVYLYSSGGSFIMSGGLIYADDTDDTLNNKANSNGNSLSTNAGSPTARYDGDYSSYGYGGIGNIFPDSITIYMSVTLPEP
ncbi:MAG: hypothetical protein FWH53_08455 [Leptospirales bacterium]|nr:hypothetical protein [Leptospirales bacterium]